MNAPADYQQFIRLPSDEELSLAWPTPNRHLHRVAARYFARTVANPDYGKPGWTRDGGRRFHRGCDIAPLHVAPTGQRTRVMFTDGLTGQEYPSVEPTFIPFDDVQCVCQGVVAELVVDQSLSDFGKHVLVRHSWPVSGESFFTLYAHLADVAVAVGCPLATGQRIGQMGQTSRSRDARNWMAIAPHLHFEVRAADQRPYDPVDFLRRFLPRR